MINVFILLSSNVNNKVTDHQSTTLGNNDLLNM
jgi:hypothetical protein